MFNQLIFNTLPALDSVNLHKISLCFFKEISYSQPLQLKVMLEKEY